MNRLMQRHESRR